jgi:hypothetical protein
MQLAAINFRTLYATDRRKQLSNLKKMKKQTLFLLLFGVIISFCFQRQIASDKNQTVNAILGDISFIEKFRCQPDLSTNENLRITTHLEYVEKLLRHKKVTNLSPELRQRRNHLLDLLRDYREAGIFPRNYDYKESRKPCFIDKDNRICAVGYLIEKTAGRRIAEDINEHHMYEEILMMNNKTADSWIETSGLSKEECAMIQPAYGGVYPPTSNNNVTPAYGISSSVLGGVNVSINTLSLLQTFKGSSNKSLEIIGLITGAGQTILGVSSFPKSTVNLYGNTTINESRKTLSMVNIGLGTATMFLSTWNLIKNKKHKDTKNTLNLNSFETPNNTIGMTVSLGRRI